ncbi:hypothetical protein ACFQ10_41210 [Streptomyces indonesiensis]
MAVRFDVMGTQHTGTGASEDLPNNWGRWGEDDERGTLNLITGEARARGAAEARTGRTVSLALPIRRRRSSAVPSRPPPRTPRRSSR